MSNPYVSCSKSETIVQCFVRDSFSVFVVDLTCFMAETELQISMRNLSPWEAFQNLFSLV